MATTTIVRLVGTDGIERRISKRLAMISPTLRDMLEVITEANPLVPLNYSGNAIALAIEFMTHDASDPEAGMPRVYPDNDLIGAFTQWDRTFAGKYRTDPSMLLEIINIADHLGLSRLLDISLRIVAQILRTSTSINGFCAAVGINARDISPAEYTRIAQDPPWT